MELGKAITAMPSKQRIAARYLAGFFAVMALLTFLSRAADSFTVPMITTVKISQGALEYKVICEGSLFPVTQIPVFAPAGCRILTMYVEEGGRVEAGDVLAEIETTQMLEQLDAAKAELQKLNLSAAARAVKAVNETDENGITAAEKALERAAADMEIAEKESQLRIESAQNEVYAARRYLRELRDMDEVSDMELDEARNALRRQEQALDEAYLAQEKALEIANRTIEDAEALIEKEKTSVEKAAEASSADRQREGLERQAAYVDVELAQRKVDELESLLESGGIVSAVSSGIVMEIHGGVGGLTSGESLFVLSDFTKETVFRASVSEDELKHIRRGNRGSLVLTGENHSVEATVGSISPVANEDGKFGLTASLPAGDWEPGTSGKFTVIQKTASYSQCVPNGAVRKDQTGNFVLVVREENGILGVHTVAERINVSVLERDAVRCAIEGPLDREDLIIMGGSRPVSAGDRVRVE